MSEMQKIDIASRTVFRIVLILGAFWFIYIIKDVLLMLFAAVIISSAIEPLADKLQLYRIPRAATVLAVYAIALLFLSFGLTLIIPALTEQVTQLSEAIPQLFGFVERFNILGTHVDSQTIVSSLQNVLLGFGNNLTSGSFNIFQQTRSLFSGLFSIIFVFVLAFYLVVENDAIVKLFRLLTPRKHFPYVEQTVHRIQHGLGRWVGAQLGLAVLVGVVVGTGLWLLGVKYALLLGIVAGILEIIPMIGPIIAAVPAVIIGISQSWLYGIVVLIFYVVVQEVENHVFVPNIMRRAAGLNPLVTIIAILLGARLAGVLGVILSVPLAIILTVFWSDLFSTGVAEPLSSHPHQDYSQRDHNRL